MPKHIVRLLTVIAVLAIVALSARWFFRDSSFYQYGHYRGKAPAEIASKLPKIQGSASCQSCHKAIYTEWSSGIHRKSTKDNAVPGVVVKSGPNCEVCHTPAGNHPSKEPMPLSVEDRITTITHLKEHTHASNVPGRKLLLTPDEMRGLCMNCHEKMPGRPAFQPMVNVNAHAGEELCTTCHNPHSPKINFDKVPRMVAMKKAVVGNAAAGKAVSANCATCHGASGVSASGAIPNLAGQKPAYLANALRAYKSNLRSNGIMSAMASALSDADIENAAAFYAQNSCKAPSGDKGKAVAGKAKYAEAGCASCHSSGGLRGAGLAGVSASQAWPNLAGQNAEYLVGALKAYQEGNMKANQDGARYHSIMTNVAKTLSASDIENLAAFLASTNCK
jgi:cytochrome c553